MNSNIQKSVQSLSNFIEHYKTLNQNVSKSGVDWHIDHCLRVVNGISKVLQNSNQNDYKSAFNFKRSLLLSLGTMPRGRAKAPQTVQATDDITLDDLQNLHQKAVQSLDILKTLPSNSHFQHPYFGMLNLKQSIRFIEVHNNHHLKIIRDILK
jgi:hypothetical protein